MKERLSFRTLEREVVEPGICAACYGCVSFCTANELNVLKIENMAERKRQRGRKVLSQRKTTVHTRKKPN